MADYSSLAPFYDCLTENVDYEKRAQYILSLLHRFGKEQGILLDLACGTGEMSIFLAESGFDVIGVDRSEDMLMEAQAKCSEGIMWLCQDMRELDLYGTIECAVCLLDSLNHLPDSSAVLQTLCRVSLFLESGGIFIFDVNTLYKHREILADNSFVYDMESVYCVWQSSLCEDGATVDLHIDLFCELEDGSYERTEEDFSERAYSFEELSDLVQRAGLSLVARYDELSLNPPTEATAREFWVCKKP